MPLQVIGNSRYNNSASPVKYIKDIKRECQSSHDRRHMNNSNSNQISIINNGQTTQIPVKIQNGIYLVMPSYSRSIKEHLKDKERSNSINQHQRETLVKNNKDDKNNLLNTFNQLNPHSLNVNLKERDQMI